MKVFEAKQKATKENQPNEKPPAQPKELKGSTSHV
jgi:hypothetical protein